MEVTDEAAELIDRFLIRRSMVKGLNMAEEMLTLEAIQAWSEKIAEMTQLEMARLQRFAPSGHPIFDSRYPLYDQFAARFKSLGGMTPQISKQLGW